MLPSDWMDEILSVRVSGGLFFADPEGKAVVAVWRGGAVAAPDDVAPDDFRRQAEAGFPTPLLSRAREGLAEYACGK